MRLEALTAIRAVAQIREAAVSAAGRQIPLQGLRGARRATSS